MASRQGPRRKGRIILLRCSGAHYPVKPAVYEEGLAKKAPSISESEARRAKEEEDALVERRARWAGVFVAMLGATLMVLAVVLGAEPW